MNVTLLYARVDKVVKKGKAAVARLSFPLGPSCRGHIDAILDPERQRLIRVGTTYFLEGTLESGVVRVSRVDFGPRQ